MQFVERVEYFVSGLGGDGSETVVFEIKVANMIWAYALPDKLVHFLEHTVAFAAAARAGDYFDEIADTGLEGGSETEIALQYRAIVVEREVADGLPDDAIHIASFGLIWLDVEEGDFGITGSFSLPV